MCCNTSPEAGPSVPRRARQIKKDFSPIWISCEGDQGRIRCEMSGGSAMPVVEEEEVMEVEEGVGAGTYISYTI